MPLDADDSLVPPPESSQHYDFDATATDFPDTVPQGSAPQEIEEELEEEPGDEDEDPAPDEAPEKFDPRFREPFKGLLWVGYLEREFDFWHHHFRIVTPSRRVRIEIGLVIQEYRDTPTWELAWQSAVVAAFLESVDGVDLPKPVVKNSGQTLLSERYNWVVDNMYDPVIDHVYDRCFELWKKVDDVMEAMGKASG